MCSEHEAQATYRARALRSLLPEPVPGHQHVGASSPAWLLMHLPAFFAPGTRQRALASSLPLCIPSGTARDQNGLTGPT